MTSCVRRKLARQIVEFIGASSSSSIDLCNSVDALAASMRMSMASNDNGILPEIHIPAEALRQTLSCEWLDLSDRLPLDKLQFPYMRASEGETSFLAVGIQRSILSECVLRSIMNSSNLWKDNVNFSVSQRLKVIVEFSSPNISKPFHAGHLRSTILGNFVANIHEIIGHEVIRINYLGDWGTQFGTLAKGYQLFGDEAKLRADPIHHLFEIYVQANKLASSNKDFHCEAMEEFRKLENGDAFAMKLWRQFRELSVDDLTKTYKRLGIHFDCYEGESMYQAKVSDLCARLQTLGLLKEKSDGTKVIQYEHPSGEREVILQKSDGTSLYLSRDIAAAINRMEVYKFDRLFHVVENGQSDHFLALFNVLKSMGHNWANHMTHVKFGRVKGMSTRKGTVVFLKDILDEAKNLSIDAMRKSPNTRVDEQQLEEIGDILGVASVLVNDMRSRRLQDFDFSWTKMTQTKGDTGLFLLYVHARLCSLKDNCGVGMVPECDLSSLKEPDVIRLIYQLARYDDVCISAYSELQPCSIVQYLFTLGRTINRALESIRIKGQPKEFAEPRLLVFSAARRVLADGMKVLGLCPLRRM